MITCKQPPVNNKRRDSSVSIFRGKRIIKMFFVTFACMLCIKGKTYSQVTALLKAPSSAATGSTIIIKIAINRGKINGFMKFSQPLPDGYQAIELDSKSGDFRYENNEIKIIWLKAPTEITYTVAYKIKIPKNASGVLTLGGKIIYVTNTNERKIFDFLGKKITLTNDPIVSNKSEVKTHQSGEEKDLKETKANTKAEKKDQEKEDAAVQTSSPAPRTNNSNNISKNVSNKSYSYLMGGLTAGNTFITSTSKPPSSAKTYRVQIGAFRNPPKIKNVPEHSTIVFNDVTKHYSGNFTSYEAAAQRKKEMKQLGFKDAFIAEFPAFQKQISNQIYDNWWQAIKY